MWDKDDISSRWVQGIIALPLIAWAIIGLYLIAVTPYHSVNRMSGAIIASVIGAIYLAGRCLWYAFTGRNCINREDY
jgi:hypothetical protein